MGALKRRDHPTWLQALSLHFHGCTPDTAALRASNNKRQREADEEAHAAIEQERVYQEDLKEQERLADEARDEIANSVQGMLDSAESAGLSPKRARRLTSGITWSPSSQRGQHAIGSSSSSSTDPAPVGAVGAAASAASTGEVPPPPPQAWEAVPNKPIGTEEPFFHGLPSPTEACPLCGQMAAQWDTFGKTEPKKVWYWCKACRKIRYSPFNFDNLPGRHPPRGPGVGASGISG
jgi:hypothetical protein